MLHLVRVNNSETILRITQETSILIDQSLQSRPFSIYSTEYKSEIEMRKCFPPKLHNFTIGNQKERRF
jgi:hypothetical protein